MPRIEEVTVYQFAELDAKAKEKARDWWRELEAQDFDTEFLFSDFKAVAKILGIEFSQRKFKTVGGHERSEPVICWGLHVQGSGASFSGLYSYAKGSAKAIRKHAPNDVKLHAMADELAALQKRHGYKLNAATQARDVASYSMDVTMDTQDGSRIGGDWDDVEADLRAILRRFADWMYRAIDREYDYRMSAENVDDAITANEYEFTASGNLWNG